jgi:magnesium transporter
MSDTPEQRPPGFPDPTPEDTTREAVETPGVINPVFLARFIGAIGDGDVHLLRRTLEDLHPADAADLLEALSSDSFARAIHLVDVFLPAEVAAELSDDVRHKALEELSDAGVAHLIENLEADDASFILNDIEEDRRTRILAKVSASDRAAIESSLAFDEESAGRLMQRDFVAAPVFWTVGQAIDHMRAVGADELPDTFFEVYIVDPAFRLEGSVPLSTLLSSARETALKDIMKEPAIRVRPETDQEEVAYAFQQYNLVSAPVVDDAGRLTGMITVDDMVDVIQEENREDILALSGVSEAGANQTVLSAVRARIPWLGLNLATAFVASLVVSQFSEVIAHEVALASLMPVVAGLSGNAGSQSLTVAVRAIAERELEGPMIARAIRREALAAIINGLAIGLLAGVVSLLMFHDIRLSGIIALAMFLTFNWAGLIGIFAPLALRRIGADPAVASSVFVLTSIDLMAFFLFLGLATLVLL